MLKLHWWVVLSFALLAVLNLGVYALAREVKKIPEVEMDVHSSWTAAAIVMAVSAYEATPIILDLN
jgi:hypothetical protein